MKLILLIVCGMFIRGHILAQALYELKNGWYCTNIMEVKVDGKMLSNPDYSISGWMPATVPGTVLTSLLNNEKVPDPFYGINNEKIRDIYFTGNEHYTYWFINDFKESAKRNEEVWLRLRGVNYKCEVFLNGYRLNKTIHEGMMLRQEYNITNTLRKNGNNRIAILVYPPDFPGNPNGGQGGDGTIAKGLTTQYTAGWDWIQPVRDRNTGIWDKVFIRKTKGIQIKNPHIVTIVPGVRLPGADQREAIIKVSSEIENSSGRNISGILQYKLAGKIIRAKVTMRPGVVITVKLPDLLLEQARLWWPSGYGNQHMYTIQLEFIAADQQLLDKESISFGVRQIDTRWNTDTRSMETLVNGQRIFVKGGNWIISDAMLRFSEARYDAEVRFHRDMNLNLIRIWGGAIIERPEFYKACDKYGLLVFQDFGFSGDCNGRWTDPMKKDDQWTRRNYPDNHALALTTAADQIKMIRNHPSLAFWCGGNEITPPQDILLPLRDSILPLLDGTRHFFDFSNSDSMSFNSLGGNGDGPYNIQDINAFWQTRTYPYNSEVGSVGVGDYASLERFIPSGNMIAPQHNGKIDSVWEYHKYISYNEYLDPYGISTGVKDFSMKAQLVNYNQYRALAEGFSSHIWDWYTGFIIWKTQNPWTALRGQMYDCYLDANACLYGLRKGSEPLHIMMNPADSMVMIVNNGFVTERDLMMEVTVYDVLTGKDSVYTTMFNEAGPSVSRKYFSISAFLKAQKQKEGIFVNLRLLRKDRSLASENFYWLAGTDGKYTALQKMPAVSLQVTGRHISAGKIEITVTNPSGNAVAFFNRFALIEAATGKRILPVFYSDNYTTVLPGETKKVEAEYPVSGSQELPAINVYGWNVDSQIIKIAM